MRAMPWFLGLLLVAPARADERSITVAADRESVGRFERIEFSLDVAAVGASPYDPADIDLRLDLSAPSGRTLSIPAFWYQPFEHRPGTPGGGDWLYPAGPPSWKARFAPTEVGRYTGVATLRDRAGTAASRPFAFTCAPSDRRGFVRVSTDDPRYLAFDDGTPFFAVGQNVAFVKDSAQTLAMIKSLGANGANFARVWACAEDWALAIEARRSAWGRSWDWRPPIVALPDRDGYGSDALAVMLQGDAGTRLDLSPTRPVALRPDTRYRLAGRVRTEGGAAVTLAFEGDHALPAGRGWTPFTHEFTTAPNQRWLPPLAFRLAADGSAWLHDLSLTEAAGGPELLGEADPSRPARGRYNQPDCFLLDRIVEAAETHGVYLQVVLLTRDHYMGDLASSGDPAYERALADAGRLARYAAARWGHSTHVAAWEYFNEIDPGLPLDRFHDALGRVLETEDVNRHLRTTSGWHSPAPHDRHPSLETANLHHYLRPPSGPIWKDETASVQAQWTAMQTFAAGKPILFSEFGITDASWQRHPLLDRDREFRHLHNALWASMLSGFASTACHWYWDDIHQRDLYGLYRPIARFAAEVPWTTGRLRPADAAADGLRIVGLAGDRGAYLWIADPAATWWNVAVEDAQPRTIDAAAVRLAGLPPGDYRVRWWDTQRGEVLSEAVVPTTGDILNVATPPFTGDIAAAIDRVEPNP